MLVCRGSGLAADGDVVLSETQGLIDLTLLRFTQQLAPDNSLSNVVRVIR